MIIERSLLIVNCRDLRKILPSVAPFSLTMNLDQIKEIVKTYEKHDWVLRKILLSRESEESFVQSLKSTFQSAEYRPFEISAAWFSRPSKNASEAWELRLLSENPFALFETFPSDCEVDKRETKLKEMETRLADLSSKA